MGTEKILSAEFGRFSIGYGKWVELHCLCNQVTKYFDDEVTTFAKKKINEQTSRESVLLM